MTHPYQSAGALTLPAEPASARPARRFVQELLDAAGLETDVVATAVLLTSELVTNAVLHTGSEVEVRVGVGEAAGTRIEVRDDSALLPRARDHAADSVTGRGLHLVATLASSFGVASVPGDGKIVWFIVGDDAGPPSPGWGEQRRTTSGVRVELHHLPVVLYDVMSEHHEALLREYTLLLLEEGRQPELLQDIAAVERCRLFLDAAVADSRSNETRGAVVSHVDLSLPTSAPDSEGYELATRVLAAAESEARAGRLLTRPALPEIGDLRGWLFGQIVRQLRGEGPTRWEFTDTAATANTSNKAEPAPMLAEEFDTAWVQSVEKAVIVADERNQVLAVSPAVTRVLGWDASELVGQRLTMIIPPRLREAHVAGFTRQLVTGRRLLLDREVQLPALHRDGHEVVVSVTLKKEARNGRAIFSAWLAA